MCYQNVALMLTDKLPTFYRHFTDGLPTELPTFFMLWFHRSSRPDFFRGIMPLQKIFWEFPKNLAKIAFLAAYLYKGLFWHLHLDNFIACAMGKANPGHSKPLHRNRHAIRAKSPCSARVLGCQFCHQGIFIPSLRFWHFIAWRKMYAQFAK